MDKAPSIITNGDEDTKPLAPGPSFSRLQLETANPGQSSLRFCLFSIGLLMGLFLSLLDTTIIATALFEIGTEFKASESVNWVALAYTLTYLGFAVLISRISDIVGRRNAFTASYVVFIISSIACGCALDLNLLIALRAVQGLGGSGLYSLSMIILPEVSPPKLRQYLGGIVGIMVTLSTVAGPVLGGALTRCATWRWVFWINGPIGAVSMSLFYLLWPKHKVSVNSQRRSWKNLDYIGSVLLIAGSVLVVFPFQNAGSTTDYWSKSVFIVPLVLGVVSWISLVLWSFFVERSRTETIDAALPMVLMRHPVYLGTVLSTIFIGFPYMLIIYAFPLRLQVVNGKDALTSGLMLLPMLVPSALGSFVAGKVNANKRWIFETLFGSSCLAVLGCGLLSTLSSSYDLEAKSLGFLVFVGFGFGISVSTATLVATTYSSPKDRAPAQGIIAQVRVLGGSLGIATSSALLSVMLQNQQVAVSQANSDAFNESMRVGAIMAAVAALSAFLTFGKKPVSLSQLKDESNNT